MEGDEVGGVDLDPSFQPLMTRCGPIYLIHVPLSLEPQTIWSYSLFLVCVFSLGTFDWYPLLNISYPGPLLY